MQKRERYCKGLGRAALIAWFCCALSPGKVMASDSWERGMGGVVFPRRSHPAAVDGTGGYLLVSASAANPFSIPGLYESTALFSMVRRRWTAAIRWERTGITGYTRDLFETSSGMALPGDFLYINVIVRADSRNVAGYGRDTIASTAYSVSMEASSLAVIEVEAGTRPDERPVRVTVRAGRSGTILVLTVGRNSRGESVVRAGGSIRLMRRVSFLAGYDLETGEVSGGLAVVAPARTAVSWSIHPVLGATFSVSVGAVR